jgi:uncharacterized protein
MKHVTMRFYGALNDFLPSERRGRAFVHPFSGSPAVKDLIESLGPPHPEVDLVLVNGEAVGFSERVQDGARVSVFPPFHAVDVGGLRRVGPPPLAEPRFVLDVGLGRLASYLRMLGFDALWRNDFTDAELARLSSDEARVVLTRDVGLLKRSEVVHGYFPRATQPEHQLVEVVRRFHLAGRMHPFTRCLACNAALVKATLTHVEAEVPPRARERHAHFLQCPHCLRVYWEGTHHARMQTLVDKLREVEQRP